MTRADIKLNILQKIDEISPYSQSDEQYDLLIESMLDDMANRYVLIVPIQWLDDTVLSSITGGIQHGINMFYDMAMVKRPADFNRLVNVSCVYWNRDVTEKDFLNENSGEYNRQFDIHTKAGLASPKVFLLSGGNFLVCPYRDHWDLSFLSMTYYRKIVAEDIEDKILDGFYYYCASSVLSSMRQEDFAKVLMDKCTEFLSIKK